MKTRLFLGLIALGVLITACSVEELQNDDFKLNNTVHETVEHYTMSTDSTSVNNNDFDNGKEDPIED